jgi:ABC-type phosphate transport system permease subunit
VLPWALPNIITALLLGAAEAAGSVTVLLFVAGSGENGVGPLREVTSLAYLVFDSSDGKSKAFRDVMGQYNFSAALLLLMMTLVLTAGALLMRARFSDRYRGGLAGG